MSMTDKLITEYILGKISNIEPPHVPLHKHNERSAYLLGYLDAIEAVIKEFTDGK
jgi:hypothetical protein